MASERNAQIRLKPKPLFLPAARVAEHSLMDGDSFASMVENSLANDVACAMLAFLPTSTFECAAKLAVPSKYDR